MGLERAAGNTSQALAPQLGMGQQYNGCSVTFASKLYECRLTGKLPGIPYADLKPAGWRWGDMKAEAEAGGSGASSAAAASDGGGAGSGGSGQPPPLVLERLCLPRAAYRGHAVTTLLPVAMATSECQAAAAAEAAAAAMAAAATASRVRGPREKKEYCQLTVKFRRFLLGDI